MATGNITANEPEGWQVVSGESVHIAAHGDFGSGSIAVEQRINDNPYPVLDEGVAIVFTEATDFRLNTHAGDLIRLNMTGSTSADVDFNIAGASINR